MTIVYGVDTTKPMSAADVRDAMVECFVQAHSQELEELQSFGDVTDEEFEDIKRINVVQLIRNFFHETHGDFDTPTKESLQRVIEKLREFSSHFRTQNIIDAHTREITSLIACLP